MGYFLNWVLNVFKFLRLYGTPGVYFILETDCIFILFSDCYRKNQSELYFLNLQLSTTLCTSRDLCSKFWTWRLMMLCLHSLLVVWIVSPSRSATMVIMVVNPNLICFNKTLESCCKNNGWCASSLQNKCENSCIWFGCLSMHMLSSSECGNAMIYTLKVFATLIQIKNLFWPHWKYYENKCYGHEELF